MKNKCKNCKDIKAQFYNCDICSYASEERSSCSSNKTDNKVIKASCVINVSSKSIPSVEGIVMPSAIPSTLF